jgi:hypothetical protein
VLEAAGPAWDRGHCRLEFARSGFSGIDAG